MMSTDEIAIVGAGCRFPGAENLEEFWRVLVNGENHVKDIPDSRWNTSAFYDDDKQNHGKIYVKKAGLLKNHDMWDNKLFGISDVEASRIDPQQRYVLECVHMALEDGGFTRKQISGSKTGVIIGCMNDDYKSMANSNLSEIGSYNATGTSTSVISARVAYVYNLHGTCLTLDTACSSALVTIHLAIQAIKTGDCDMVICGGVNSILTPDTFKAPCEARMMSAIGQCQSFCDTADGYARGEGCGIVILKSLKAAVEDSNKVWAKISTGSNQDGCTMKPMTAPSRDQQLELLKHVYETSLFNPCDIQYIEAHGTGTPRGDPIEVNALGEFFSVFRNETMEPLLVGSVKSNIGHTESAAGTAGLLKVLLMMKHGLYVPSLHINSDKSNFNPKIKLSDFGLEICTSTKAWPCKENGERHACLNSFGFGGSNTHAIITQKTQEIRKVDESQIQNQITPICITGVDKKSLKLNLLQLHDDLDNCSSSTCISDVAYTSFNHRDIFPYRTLVYGKSIQDIQDECQGRARQCDKISHKRKNKKIFVYCGVGTTWTGMCQELMHSSDVFRTAIHEIDIYLEPLTGWKIGERFILNTCYDDPFLNHIAIFCCQVALTEFWRSFGIVPDVVIGQSVGEVAAAYAANFLTLEEAVKIVITRSEILSRQDEGSMAVIGNVDIKEIEDVCRKLENDACIAVYSSPSACTISGRASVLKMIIESLENDTNDKKLLIKPLKVRCAYHSPLLDCCLDEVKTKIDACYKNVKQKSGCLQTIPMMSTTTGKYVVPEDMKSGRYWARNVRDPVLFMQAIKQVYDKEAFGVFIEIGPRSVLKAHFLNILGHDCNARTIPSLSVNAEMPCLYRSLSKIFELGIDIHFSPICTPMNSVITPIPRYKFNRTGSLFIPATTKDYLSGFSRVQDTDHLFVRNSRTSDDIISVICIDEISTPFVYDHFFFDEVIVPGATYVEAGFHVGKDILRRPVDKLSVSLDFMKTLKPLVGQKHNITIQMASKNDESLHFYAKDDRNVLARGIVSNRKSIAREPFDLKYLKTQCTVYRSKSECYDYLKSLNFEYGSSLKLIQRAWTSASRTKCLTEIHLSNEQFNTLSKTHFHPAVIDSMFQIFGIFVKDKAGEGRKFVVPKGVESVVLNKSMDRFMYGYAEEVKITKSGSFYNAVLLSDTGTVIAEIENFFTKIVSANYGEVDKSIEYTLNWSEVFEVPDTKEVAPSHVILCTSKTGSETVRKLQNVANITIYTEVDRMLQEINILSPTATLVYHIAGFVNTYIENNGAFILNCAVKCFLDVKRLLASVKDLSVRPSITIITENTQLCPGREKISFIGSELWGMLRSAVHEGFNKNIRLVDIDRDSFDASILSKLFYSTHFIGTEFAISDSNLFRSTFQQCRRDNEFKRLISTSEFDKMAIYSSSVKKVSEPYFMLSTSDEMEIDNEQIILESFTLHDKSLYLPTLEEDADKFDLKLHTDEGQIVVVEGHGKRLKTGDDIRFLYPINASTIVSVPSEYQIDLADIPVYSSGILMLTNILFHMVSRIAEGTSIMVITESEEKDICQQLLLRLLSRKQCRTQFCTIDDIDKVNFSTISALLITTFISRYFWKHVFTAVSRPVMIVMLKMHIREDDENWLKHNFPDNCFIILSTSELFSTKGIKDALPSIRDCLHHLNYNAEERIANKSLLQLPMSDLQVKERLESGSFKCFCNAGNIFRQNACYVIVGGLTGLGWELLSQMVEMGAGILITLSRSKPSDESELKAKELQLKFSCKIIHMQVDISELDTVQQTFTEIQNRFPNCPIRGIFHGAGVIMDSILDNLNEQYVIDVLKPKILGAWNLHLVSLNLNLDYFVLNSSVVSVIGNPAQTNYSAANSFLDSFALYRRSIGLPAQSINWGALSTGMAVENDAVKSKLSRKGFGFLEKETIRDCFSKALVNDMTNIVFADIEWNKLLLIPTFAMQSLKYMELQTVRSVQINDSRLKNIDVASLIKKDPTERIEIVRDALKEIIEEVLITHDESWTDQTMFAELGIDSMAATSLAVRIDEVFKCRVSIVMLLSEDTTLTTIVEFVAKNMGQTTESDEKRETIIETDDPEIQYLFENKNISYMQKELLTNYLLNKKDPYFLRVMDVEIFGIQLHIDKWKMILNHVFKLRTELRRTYEFTENGDLSIEIINEDDIDVDAAMVLAETLENNQCSDARMIYNPDINKSVPFLFRIAESEYNTIFRIVTHALAIDMKGISMLCKDIEKTLTAYLAEKTLPEKYPTIDIAALVKRSILPRIAELAQFWDNYTNYEMKPLTLGETIQELDVNFCSISTLSIPSKTIVAIKKYVATQSISVYEFFMSLYQLYLYLGSKVSIVPVGTAADMRFHIPELRNVITRCVNYLPIIAHIDQAYTLAEFIKYNSSQISTTTKHGAYPSSLILKKIKSTDAREHVFRHFLSMNDMAVIDEISKDQIRAEIKRVWFMRPDRETFVYVSHNFGKSQINLEVGFNSKICGRFGQSLPEKLLWLANEALSNGSEKIEKLQDVLKTTDPTKIQITGFQDVVPTNDSEKIQPKEKIIEFEETIKKASGTDRCREAFSKPKVDLRKDQQEPLSESVRKCEIQTTNIQDEKMSQIVDFPSTEVRALKNKVGNENGSYIYKGLFKKQTTYGWDHTVQVSLGHVCGQYFLQWANAKDRRRKKDKRLDLNNLTGVHVGILNGFPSLVITSGGRKIILKTPDRTLAKQLFEKITVLVGNHEV